MILGQDLQRVFPISLDLRPITDLLTWRAFGDPAIYVDLKARLEAELAAYMLEAELPAALAPREFTPEIYMVSLESLLLKRVGSEGITGAVTLAHRAPGADEFGPEREIWTGDDGAGEPLDGDEIKLSSAVPVRVVPGLGGRGALRISAQYTATATRETLSPISIEIDLEDLARTGRDGTNVITALGDDCRCVTACPNGYSDYDGACRKDCPVGPGLDFDERGRRCFGTEFPTGYLAGFKHRCEEQHVSRFPNSDEDACEWVWSSLAYFPKCRQNFFRSGIGTCVPDCEKFGLEKAPASVTCLRPQAERSKTARAPGAQCPSGATPGTDCTRVEARFSVTKVLLPGSVGG